MNHDDTTGTTKHRNSPSISPVFLCVFTPWRDIYNKTVSRKGAKAQKEKSKGMEL